MEKPQRKHIADLREAVEAIKRLEKAFKKGKAEVKDLSDLRTARAFVAQVIISLERESLLS